MTKCQGRNFLWILNPDISAIFERLLMNRKIAVVLVCYVKNCILMRKWRPPHILAEDEWTVKRQILIPLVYYLEKLNLVHETSVSGHLSVNKTYHKISKGFIGEDLNLMYLNTVIPAIHVKW